MNCAQISDLAILSRLEPDALIQRLIAAPKLRDPLLTFLVRRKEEMTESLKLAKQQNNTASQELFSAELARVEAVTTLVTEIK